MTSSCSSMSSESLLARSTGVVTIEKEISYSINLSQDLLFIILESYISKNFVLSCEYFECVNENDVRSRLTGGRFVSTIKQTESLRKFVYVHENGLMPLVDRVSSERAVEFGPSEEEVRIKKILTCQVYRPSGRSPVEIKFEKIYLDYNASYKFDSLMASKQIALLNLLQSKTKNENRQSFLGSDEILANLRLECEYETAADADALRTMLDIAAGAEAFALAHNIEPALPYTTLQNAIVCRKFEEERALVEGGPIDDSDVLKWAIKLDGMRGRGLLTRRGGLVVFMDDMRVFSGDLPWPFRLNNAVALQCELVDDEVLYVTDVLHVFKYTYNNRTQYECSLDAYPVDAVAAIECIDRLHATAPDLVLRSKTEGAPDLRVKFQKFFDPPLTTGGYNSVPSDGYVALDSRLRYVKYKSAKTVELEYDETLDRFCSLEGPLTDHETRNDAGCVLRHGAVYETVLRDKCVHVLKLRPDRLLAQALHEPAV
uniref:LEF-4 n=2 Tax=Lymantria dispar multicapsid nuclear polyhedrosis virus TaxID=10449 RepID=A0A140HRF0_NPVLD|nr:LEF-4 [Lymantria dispar multiple nucleopolyhedrovirus]AWJ76707.1 lef-4 [Lymantria dispar multiple nucleopolyhedrovirus]WAK98442.1 ORF93 Ld-lef4 [Lymantria dispar multiple nucleopolyhedrovirus]WAK98593.1 ORF93 Ld-lef4 [Lymantria dispar multiple nucleopolyhedrovirus]